MGNDKNVVETKVELVGVEMKMSEVLLGGLVKRFEDSNFEIFTIQTTISGKTTTSSGIRFFSSKYQVQTIRAWIQGAQFALTGK